MKLSLITERFITRQDIISGGLADKVNVSDFDSKQLEMGIKVELEHTKDEKLAREIAMDHLKEDPHYYTKLSKAGL
jgi:hypothetical protein